MKSLYWDPIFLDNFMVKSTVELIEEEYRMKPNQNWSKNWRIKTMQNDWDIHMDGQS